MTFSSITQIEFWEITGTQIIQQAHLAWYVETRVWLSLIIFSARSNNLPLARRCYGSGRSKLHKQFTIHVWQYVKKKKKCNHTSQCPITFTRDITDDLPHNIHFAQFKSFFKINLKQSIDFSWTCDCTHKDHTMHGTNTVPSSQVGMATMLILLTIGS